MNRTGSYRTAGWLRSGIGALTPVLAVLLASACNSLLEVEAPSRVSADDLLDPSFAELRVTSAVGDFDCALANYIVTTGTVVDEFDGAHTASAEAFDYDRRTVDHTRQQYATRECDGGIGAIYQPLSTAVWQADEAITLLNSFSDQDVDDRATLIQTVNAYGGYGRVLLGEGFCTAAVNLSAELTPDDLFAQAEQQFTDAMGGPDAQLATMAQLGRARARRNLGNTAGALADAQAIPAGFVQNAQYSSGTSRSYNIPYSRNGLGQTNTVSPQTRNLMFLGVPDPRVEVVNTGLIGGDGISEIWVQQKYQSLSDPIPIARYAEAQLIIAEIELGQTAVDIINDLHGAAGLPDFVPNDVNDDTEILDHVIEERRREFFLEGHRFWDFRRFDLPFDPPVGTVYPKGGFYGDTRCFPLPDLERDNNPNIGAS